MKCKVVDQNKPIRLGSSGDKMENSFEAFKPLCPFCHRRHSGDYKCDATPPHKLNATPLGKDARITALESDAEVDAQLIRDKDERIADLLQQASVMEAQCRQLDERIAELEVETWRHEEGRLHQLSMARWDCNRGHVWIRFISDKRDGSECPMCAAAAQAGEIERLKALAEKLKEQCRGYKDNLTGAVHELIRPPTCPRCAHVHMKDLPSGQCGVAFPRYPFTPCRCEHYRRSPATRQPLREMPACCHDALTHFGVHAEGCSYSPRGGEGK